MVEMQGNDLILCRDLTKIYKMGEVDVQALRGLNLRVERGEFVAVLGPSGCGKTTLLQIIGGLARPSGGTVIVDGHDMNKRRDGARTRFRQEKIGFVFQRFNLLSYLTALDNVCLALKIKGEKTPENVEKAKELLDLVGLKEKFHSKPLQMSQGEQQRVAIARALITNPSIVLADEPTGNLDSGNSERILNLMKTLNKQMGQTIMMITHEQTAADYATRQVRMFDGQVVDNGRKEENSKSNAE